jgi:hypothetical protein
MIAIRPLTPSELPACFAAGNVRYDESDFSGGFDEEKFCSMWAFFIACGLGIVIGAFDGEDVVGGIGGVLGPDPVNGALVGQEVFWYGEPGREPLRLLKAFEGWSKERGGKLARVGARASCDDLGRLFKLYTRLGFRPIEVHFEKEL